MTADKTSFDDNPTTEVSFYDQAMRCFCAAYEPMFVMAYSALRSVIGEAADVLIVGAGTGMEICDFAGRGNSWRMTGVDPSADMLSIARKKIADQNIESRVELFTSFLHEMPQSNPYDAATCILVMHFLQDDGSKLGLLKSISERLKPGAPLVLIDGFADKNSAEFAYNLAAWKAFPITMGVDPQIVDDGFNNTILKRLQFVPELRIFELLDEAGFENPTRFFTSFMYGGWLAIKK